MNDYTEVRIGIKPCSEMATDIAAALLADAGFETFVPDSEGLTAYIPASKYAQELRDALTYMPFNDIEITWTAKNIEGQDWNSEWEKNYFKPIVVADRCVIHSSFHKDIPKCDYDIVIDPKMAFGTGHHSTTSLILQALLSTDLEGKSVIDMGTGTGILSILAAMRGASPVTGIEIDPPALENAVANCELNNHSEITMLLGDASLLSTLPYKADIFLANINRNVITADLPAYVTAIAPGADIFFSSFYEEDIPVILNVAEPLGLIYVDHRTLLNWGCLHLRKP